MNMKNTIMSEFSLPVLMIFVRKSRIIFKVLNFEFINS
jgi:hypothetical protein